MQNTNNIRAFKSRYKFYSGFFIFIINTLIFKINYEFFVNSIDISQEINIL